MGGRAAVTPNPSCQTLDVMSLFQRLWSRMLKRPSNPPDPLWMVEYLLNKSNDLGSRDDCAMDLHKFDLPEVEAALVTVASDALEDEMVVDSAGHSLWQIYKRQNRVVPAEVQSTLQPSAMKFFERLDV
jgi:hypothetical protein